MYRNDLMELIQYAPRTETVYETPLLMSPPWINKYYIMDLAPGRSFVEWAVEHGHTVFAISYHNPDAADRDVRLDDYLLNGPIAALDVIREITGAEQANIVGLCLGGTLTAALRAYLASAGEHRIASTTLLNTLVDFSRPGRLGAFTDRASVERLERRMAERGLPRGLGDDGHLHLHALQRPGLELRGQQLAHGRGPPPLRHPLLERRQHPHAGQHALLLPALVLPGQRARAAARWSSPGPGSTSGPIHGDHYVLAAIEDHIAPWEGSYLTTQVLPNADVRYVLSAAGHIAGIVNPPSPKAWYRTSPAAHLHGRAVAHPPDPKEWFEASVQHEGSWWEDWAEWIGARSGERVKPPRMGSRKHRPVGDAPGTYVLEK